MAARRWRSPSAVSASRRWRTVKLDGVDQQPYALFGINPSTPTSFTGYGSVRDKVTGSSAQRKAVMWGRLIKIDDDEFKRGELFGMDYAISEITHYELYQAGDELIYFDWRSSVYRSNSVSLVTDINGHLAIPGA